MEYTNRLFCTKINRYWEQFSIVVITGARQVGKTTLLKNTFPDVDYVEFDPYQDIENARHDPDLFLKNHPFPLILDEMQYAPEIAAALKRKVDQAKAPRLCLITGSQQWSVLKTLAESLAGRAILLELHPFTISELCGKPDNKNWLEAWLTAPRVFFQKNLKTLYLNRPFFETLFRGFLPKVRELPLEMVPDFHNSYIRTYIERDVRLAVDIEDYQKFGHFYRLAAALSAQELNTSQLGREIGITPQTAGRWLDALEAGYQWFQIPAWNKNTLKKLSGKAKGYICDSGLMCACLHLSSPEAAASHPQRGAIFETLVVNELKKLSGLLSVPPQMYHWRTHGGAEVDLLLERDGKIFPIEIKSHSRPTKGDARGLTAFRKTYPDLDIQPGLIIAPAEAPYPVTENDFVLPYNISLTGPDI